jgi:hypothetical protein
VRSWVLAMRLSVKARYPFTATLPTTLAQLE